MGGSAVGRRTVLMHPSGGRRPGINIFLIKVQTFSRLAAHSWEKHLWDRSTLSSHKATETSIEPDSVLF